MDDKVRAPLHAMERRLLAAPTRKVFASDAWADDITSEPGVYVFRDRKSGVPVYVGATSSLRQRMRDIRRTVNHSFRRKAAVLLNIAAGDEVALSRAMSRHYVLSYTEVFLGRAELEEFLVLRWKETVLNKPAKRLLRGQRYRWVIPASLAVKRGRARRKRRAAGLRH